MKMGTESIERFPSAKMFNLNAFRFLKALDFGSINREDLSKVFSGRDLELMHQVFAINQSGQFNENTQYGHLFSKLYTAIENNYDSLQSNSKYDALIISIYENNSDNLTKSNAEIAHIMSSNSPTKPKVEHRVSHFLDDPWHKGFSEVYPSKEEWRYRRTSTVVSSTFTPQKRTNLPFVLAKQDNVQPIHFGTQAQRVNGVVQMAKPFELYMQAKNRKGEKHLYINNLGLDRNTSYLSLEGLREYQFTRALHQCADSNDNLFVVTLPADQGRMKASMYNRTSRDIEMQAAKDDIMAVLLKPSDLDNPNHHDVKDFYLGPKVEALLFPEGTSKEEFYTGLLQQSIEFFGLQDATQISEAEKQAIYFHLFKYALTEEIIKAVAPDTMNTSCKDAIDRGKAAYAYDLLVKSFASDKPISYEEFDMSLHATSAMVKARGMNKHHQVVWNVVDVYVTNNYEELLRSPDKKWLIEWRDMNCPASRVSELLTRNIAIAKEQFKDEPENDPKRKVLAAIVDNIDHSAYNKKVLLSSLSICLALHRDPNNEATQNRCLQAVEELPTRNSFSKYLKGLLYVVLGGVSLNKSLLQKGMELVKGHQGYKELRTDGLDTLSSSGSEKSQGTISDTDDDSGDEEDYDKGSSPNPFN